MFKFNNLTPYDRNHDRDFFENLFNEPFFRMPFSESMKTDIKESETGYDVSVDMPGVPKQDISLNYDNNGVLSVSVNNVEEKKIEKENYLRKERRMGSYRRDFYLPNVDSSKITAKYENGVLKISLPKRGGNDAETNISID